jgi:hypothetical protein
MTEISTRDFFWDKEGAREMTRLTSSHDDRRGYHQLPVVASENAKEPEHDDSTSKDAKADGETTDADANGVMTVDVEGLGRPEHDDREKVGAGDESDDQSQDQDTRFPLKTRWEHGEFSTLHFPDSEGNAECSSEEEGDENVGRGPIILFRELAELRLEGNWSAGTNLISSPL